MSSASVSCLLFSVQVDRSSISYLAKTTRRDLDLLSTHLPSAGIEFYIFYVYIYTNPSARAGYDTRSIFNRSLTGFNSEFSFS